MISPLSTNLICFEVEHIIKSDNGEITTITNKELDRLLSDTIFKKEEVKKMNLLVYGPKIPSKIKKEILWLAE